MGVNTVATKMFHELHKGRVEFTICLNSGLKTLYSSIK